MSRYIDADKLKRRWMIVIPELYDTNAMEVLASIDAQPTVDAVEVVRCKDCAFCTHRETYSGKLNFYYCLENDRVVELHGFCSYGERKVQECD